MNNNAKLQQWYRKQIESMKGIDPVDRFEFVEYLGDDYVLVIDIDPKERVEYALDMLNTGIGFGRKIENNDLCSYILEYDETYLCVLARDEPHLKEMIEFAIKKLIAEEESTQIEKMRSLLIDITYDLSHNTYDKNKLCERINRVLEKK